MPRFDQSQAECLVFTFKDGLLSKIAHDLKIAVTRFSVDVEPGSVRAEFDTRSLRVLTPMKDGKDNPGALNDGDKAKIAEQIVTDVLHSEQHGTASFVSRSVTPRPDGGHSISGELTLHGVTKPINVETSAAGGRQVARIELHQPDFGITPFKAMMGTLKIKPDVIVQLSVPQG
jgi:YceI-like protein